MKIKVNSCRLKGSADYDSSTPKLAAPMADALQDSKWLVHRKLYCETCKRVKKCLSVLLLNEQVQWPTCCGGKMRVHDRLKSHDTPAPGTLSTRIVKSPLPEQSSEKNRRVQCLTCGKVLNVTEQALIDAADKYWPRCCDEVMHIVLEPGEGIGDLR